MEERIGEYKYTSYVVKSGDTLQSIAEKFDITIGLLVFINNLSSYEVSEGQTLQVPDPKNNLSKEDATSGVGTIDTTHTINVSVSHPTIEVQFFGEYGKLASVSTTDKSEDLEVDNDIISVNTTRGLGQDCPTFTITLVWRNEWYTSLASNDLIVIYMQRPPEKKQAVMFGLIDDIRKSMEFSSGVPQRTVQVTGRGLNKAFIGFDVGIIDKVNALGSVNMFFDNLTQLVRCDSYNAIKIVVESYVGKAIKYKFGNGKTLEDYFVYSGNVHEDETLSDYSSYTSYKGSLWNFIKELSNSPFNETYWEIVDDKPNLIHRRTPFNKEDWINLPRTTIQDCDLVSDNTGRSDLETYTVYTVNQRHLNMEIDQYYPLWYPPYYPKYGLSQLEVSTVYTVLEGNFNEVNTQLHEDLFNFNIKNNVFENGTIVVQGKASYHVGERIILESTGMEYYVESVSHSFTCYGGWTTSLGVTRGIYPEYRFTAPWGCAQELTPAMIVAIINQTSGEVIDWTNLPEIATSSASNSSSYEEGYVDGEFAWVVPSSTKVTSGFGNRNNPIKSGTENHKGIDISAPIGTPIVSACDGKVIACGPASGYGKWIKIQHANGVTTTYGHVSSFNVTVGQLVKKGDVIGAVGNEGDSTGPHLHFQVEVNGSATDPIAYFQKKDPSGTFTNGTCSVNEKACYEYLTTVMGLNSAGACAVLGNINQESGFKCKIDGDNGTSYGLCQWHNDRKSALIKHCNSNGMSINSVEGQMSYLHHELQNRYPAVWNKLKSTPNTAGGAYSSAYYFCCNFEVPANKEQKGMERGNSAKEFFKKYS